MPRRKHAQGDHGAVRHRSEVALLIIDVLNDFDYPRSGPLLRSAGRMAEMLAPFIAQFRRRNLPVIYCNDNFGQWRSDREQVIQQSLAPDSRGRKIAAQLLPQEEDYFVLKPKHSAFYSTTLETLLGYLGVKKLILTGIAGTSCVLHTAMDAHVRGFELVVLNDCIASYSPRDQIFALHQFKNVLNADVRRAKQWRRG